MVAYLEKSPRSTGRKEEVEKGGRIGSTQCGVCVCWGGCPPGHHAHPFHAKRERETSRCGGVDTARGSQDEVKTGSKTGLLQLCETHIWK